MSELEHYKRQAELGEELAELFTSGDNIVIGQWYKKCLTTAQEILANRDREANSPDSSKCDKCDKPISGAFTLNGVAICPWCFDVEEDVVLTVTPFTRPHSSRKGRR